MQVEIYKIYHGDYKFVAELDMGAEVGANQVTLWFSEKEQQNFGTLRFLRTFYFEEANYDNIHTFCHEFATCEDYRSEILAGARHWTRRNALFVRNLYAVLGERVLLASDTSFERKAREFFRWVDMHTEEIIALPAYKRLQSLDSAFQPTATRLDPLILPAVALLNQVPGVVTRYSCQGVSGKIRLEGYELMAVSPHVEYAYVSFERLSYFAHDAIVSLLPSFPHITTARIPCNFSLELLLRSTGNNNLFRAELMTMSQCMLALWHEQGQGQEREQASQQAEAGVTNWEAAIYPERQPHTTDPGGILPSRLAWLCQPEQIERTLQLLFHLNHWAKASAHLFYADRQGLYTVKAALIRQAYASNQLRPVTYIDGTTTFAKDFAIEMAGDIAAEFLLDHLSFLFEQGRSTADEDAYDVAARQLFQRISGRAATCAGDIETIKLAQVKKYICSALHALVMRARLTRQPISRVELAALLVGPGDLLTLPYNREHLVEYWHELDETNARKLDPEGNSLIAFQYASATGRYTFHLPFRVAQRFLPGERIQDLQQYAGYSRELGTRYGRAVSASESRAYPLTEILRELAVNITSICPRQLTRKEDFYPPSPKQHQSFADEDEGDEDYGNYEAEEKEGCTAL
ncbi:MAG: hypothetical protein NVS2B12_05880 [Ktedonobacteraceae bacterium]